MASNNLLEASHFLQNHKSANPNFVQTRYIYDTWGQYQTNYYKKNKGFLLLRRILYSTGSYF